MKISPMFGICNNVLSFPRASDPKMPERDLLFAKIETGRPVIAFCSACHHTFSAVPRFFGDRTDDLILGVRAEFEEHTCDEADNVRQMNEPV